MDSGFFYGRTVVVLAPSYPVPARVVHKAVEALKAKGLTPYVPDHLQEDDPFCAASDALRAAHLQHALQLEEPAIVWAIRGGYGCTRLLPLLEQMPAPTAPKLLVGYSDITALHAFLGECEQVQCLHAPVLAEALKRPDSDDITALWHGLKTGEWPDITLEDMNQTSGTLNMEHKAPIHGGNLSILQHLLATPWQPDWQNHFLLLEELDEAPYALDRLFTQLLHTPLLKNARAVLLGEMIYDKLEADPALVQAALQRFIAACPVPVFRLPGVGHGARNWPVMLGQAYKLQTHGEKKKLMPCFA